MRPIYLVHALTLSIGIGTHSGRILLTLFALHLDAPPYAIGLLAASTSLFPFLLAVVAGRMSDRYGARRPLALAVAIAGVAMLVPYFLPGLPAVYIAALLLGLSFSFYNVALQNLVGILADPVRRVQSFGNFAIVVSVASFVGPLLAGFSVDEFGYRNASLYVALLWLLPAVLIVVLGGLLPAGTGHARAHQGTVLSTLRDPRMRNVLIICGLVQAGFDMFIFYLPVYGHSIGMSASAIGVQLAIFAAASLVARMLSQPLVSRFSVERTLAGAFYLSAVSLMLVPFFHNEVMLAVVGFLFGLGICCGQPITMMLVFTNSAPGRSGEAMGLRLTANNLTRIVSPMLFGAIATAFGLPLIFWLNALMLVGGGLLSRSKSTA